MGYRFSLVAVFVLALAPLSHADKFCFVVAGDGRSDPSARPPRSVDVDGLNAFITGEIAQAVLREKAKFLMWTGDLVLGAKSAQTFERQLMHWRKIMQPLYANKVQVLACRGNHESGSGKAEAIWNKVFSGPYAMPHNGPAHEKNLSFYYEQGDVLAIGLDQFIKEGISVDQTWLDSVLKNHRHPFVFAMGHEPAFMDGAHKDNMDNSPANRDRFWNSLIDAGARCFFAGHDHLYDHMMVRKAGEPDAVEMHQFVAGTAGAPFYAKGAYVGNNTTWTLKRIHHVDRMYGYLLVQIDGDKATITFKGRTKQGAYVPVDTWSYRAVGR